MRRPWNASAAWEFVAALLVSPGLAVPVPTHRYADVAGEVIRELPHLAGNLVHDAHTAILMREHGIRQICTRDTDFNQFSFLEIIDPLRPSFWTRQDIMPHQTLGAVVGVGAENCVESFQVDFSKMVFKMIFKVDFQNRLSVLILIEVFS
jgi:hypothetical protein